MNLKNFTVASIVGFIVYYILGAIFYGFLFPNIHPSGEYTNMFLIALGCLFYSILIAFIWCQWAGFKDWMSGLKAGSMVGLIGSASSTCFMFSSMEMNVNNFIAEILIMTISTAVIGAVIAFVNGKMSQSK